MPPAWSSSYLILYINTYMLPLDWNDFSSVCSKPDFKSGPKGNREVDSLSYSVVVCFLKHIIYPISKQGGNLKYNSYYTNVSFLKI